MTDESGWPSLSIGETLIEDDYEIIYRQIELGCLAADGTIDSRVFTPRRSDEGKLSCHRASKVTATQAAEMYSQYFDEPSVGYVRVKVADAVSAELRVIDDYGTGVVPVGHAYIDFRRHNKSQVKKRAQRLKQIVQKDGSNIVLFGKNFQTRYRSQDVQGSLPI